MDPLPAKGTVVKPALAYRGQSCGLRPHLAMAIHAHLRRGNAGVFRSFRFIVAIEAVDAVVTYVVTVIEGDRLVDGISLPRDVRSSYPQNHDDRRPHDAGRRREQTDAEYGVGPGRKKGRHSSRARRASRTPLQLAAFRSGAWQIATGEATKYTGPEP
jgi:hypothetical protein